MIYMETISTDFLNRYRRERFFSNNGKTIASLDDAVEFINARGFVFFWPNKETICPSLWNAVAGDRPVPDEHDDPGHITWGWKDNLLDKKRVYYARVLRHRNTFISLELLPYFYALSPNYGSPDDDYLIEYEAGRLTAEARSVFEALLTNGPLDTIALRKAARLTSKTSDGPFNKALDALQFNFRILPTGIAKVGAWKYAFIYNLVPRHFPWIIEKAQPITDWDARRHIIRKYLDMVGVAQTGNIARLFNWPVAHVERAVRRLLETGDLVNCLLENSAGQMVASTEFVQSDKVAKGN
jgi:hypothetical protein